MKAYKDKFLEIEINETDSIIICIWNKATSDAKSEDFKLWNTKIVETTQRYKPSHLLGNAKSYLFTVTPDLQEWSVSNIFEKLEQAGLKKMAMIVSEEIFPQVSIEQLIEENKNTTLITKYFENEEHAMKWLQE